jgi:hypothetical protein
MGGATNVPRPRGSTNLVENPTSAIAKKASDMYRK